jgi:hypothetical protein
MVRLIGPLHTAQLMQPMVQLFTGMGLAKTAMSYLLYAPQLLTMSVQIHAPTFATILAL